ncbi:MAG: hypothetical protein M2R45_00038 [Verrucomicrobia subdivision 3 bacterium]|nr:hypothetical protein [Limisphaerales bacterium]MCS1412503.1 hypothetical protein [Limisphaerales bacterium]
MNPQNREKLLLIIALSAGGILAADRLILGPLDSLWSERSTQIAELRQAIDQGRNLLDRETTITRRWQDMQRTALSKSASSAEDTVVKAANRWSNDSRITFTSFKPQWINYDDNYKIYDCRASATGDLEAICRFIYELEVDPLPIRAEEIEVSSRDDAGGKLTLALRFSGLQLTEAPQ